MVEDKILTWDEFRNSDFDATDYHFPEEEGLYWGKVDAKRWGKPKDSAMIYFTDEQDNKYVSFVWKSQKYMHLNDFHVGEKVVITFRKNKNGYNCLTDIQKA